MDKILFLTIHLPYPPHSGASMYNTFRVLQLLIKTNRVFFASLLKNGDDTNKDDFLEKTGIEDYYFEELEVPRNSINLVKSYLYNVPINVYRNYSKTFYDKIQSIANQYDILWIDHYEAFQYVPDDFQGKVVLRTHNAWHIMWQRYADVATSPLHKIMALLESKRVAKKERSYCNRADRVLCASSDGEFLEPDASVRAKKYREFLFLGDDDQLRLPVPSFESLENSMIYVGTLSWEANIDGLLWFVEGAWKELKKRVPDLKLYLIGSKPDVRLRQLAEQYEDIVLTGFVEDLEPYFTKCKINIVPLRFGSGIKVKVINGLYRGIPIVTTDTGIESIDVQPDRDLIVANDIDAMIEGIYRLMEDKNHWQTISDHARQTSRSKLTWHQLSGNLNSILDEL